jgi:hypothetical protein
VGYRTESMHGAGSPQAQRIMIARQSNMEHKKGLAKELAGVGKPWDGCRPPADAAPPAWGDVEGGPTEDK